MRHRHSWVDPWSLTLVGLLLVAGGVAGVARAVCGAVAAHHYVSAVYGEPRPSPETVMELCRKAYAWFPWNYRFSIAAAELAYRQSEGTATNAADWRRLAALWCERGLAQNPHKSQLVRLKTRLLWPEHPAQAMALWSRYTEWNYWEPYNHAVMAELHAGAGDFDLADRELALIRAFPDHGDADARVDRERRLRQAMLSGDEGEWGE